MINYYDFTTSDQKIALQNLLRRSSVIRDNQLLQDLFPARTTEEEYAIDILNFVKKTQRNLTLRAGTQERWEVRSKDWMECDREEIIGDLKTLGFTDEVKPKIKIADAICILGATKKGIADRILYLESLIHDGFQTNSIILLSGKRNVSLNIDGSQKELSSIAEKFNLRDWKFLTEAHLIQDEYNNSSLSKRKLPTYLIDTPAGALPRPTTETTVMELTHWLKDHSEIRTILFISNQPYVYYQREIISSVFMAQECHIAFEVAGPTVSPSSRVQSIVEGLGSYIFAASPSILSKMKIQITDSKIADAFKELYSKNPLIYQILFRDFQSLDSTFNHR